MSETENYRKELSPEILKEIEFRYGIVLLDGFEITDVRYSFTDDKGNDEFSIKLKLEKKK